MGSTPVGITGVAEVATVQGGVVGHQGAVAVSDQVHSISFGISRTLAQIVVGVVAVAESLVGQVGGGGGLVGGVVGHYGAVGVGNQLGCGLGAQHSGEQDNSCL